MERERETEREKIKAHSETAHVRAIDAHMCTWSL